MPPDRRCAARSPAYRTAPAPVTPTLQAAHLRGPAPVGPAEPDPRGVGIEDIEDAVRPFAPEAGGGLPDHQRQPVPHGSAHASDSRRSDAPYSDKAAARARNTAPRRAGVRSLARAFQLLEGMADCDHSLQISQLAIHAQLPVATVYRLLRTLLNLGYVYQDSSRRYALGPKIIHLGESVRTRDQMRCNMSARAGLPARRVRHAPQQTRASRG